MIGGESFSRFRSSATRHSRFERKSKAVHGRSKLATLIWTGDTAVQMKPREPPHIVSNALEARGRYRGVHDRRSLVPQTAPDALQAAHI